MIYFICTLVIVVFFLLLWLDFYLGRSAFFKKAPSFEFGRKSGTSYKLYTNGHELFPAIFKDIKQANAKIDVMFFTIRNDELSKQMYQLLIEKAREGVAVRLLVDRFGSFSFKSKIKRELIANGVQFLYSDIPRFPYYFYMLNRRNHRKITVIDQQIGYVGGYNLGKEYIGKDPKLGDWRDYHLRLEGEIVDDLQHVFVYDWNCAYYKKAVMDVPPLTKRHSLYENEPSMEMILTEGGQLEQLFYTWINQAEQEILIGSPYFIPSKRIFNALVEAMQRNVKVKLLVPIKGDHPLVKPAGIPFYRSLANAGGEVFLFDNGFYHTKILIIDKQLCDIGTANFDMRSFFLNKEVNSVVRDDPDFINAVRSAYLKDIKASIPLTEKWINDQPLSVKLQLTIAKIFRPLL
ncbi:cardiolipin synthase [Radiobacillus sp. PE A8.2]|uniref:cardiolipin synthase n=1 Tax=Radiobacillus sp. PE A8.2 TaxID=3380349 RepID=UPI00388E375D